MSEVFSRQLETTETPSSTVLANILSRVQRSVSQASDKVLARAHRVSKTQVCEGVWAKMLYVSDPASPRLGEPVRVYMLEFNPGARLNLGKGIPKVALSEGMIDREWLILSGDLTVDGEMLTDRDYKIMPRDFPEYVCESTTGASVFVRESLLQKSLSDAPSTTMDSCDNWPEYAPGIRRRVLWERDGQAAMLYLTEPNAEVPHHSHHHDEECFMVQGELYLDDTLLLEGDYQLAKGGSQHQVTRTDTGVVLFAHGDLDLRFVA
jgi:quercetin dioxygenase-like cupin family protein